MMPRRNGFEVCRAIKQDMGLADTYVVLLTAKGQAYDREQGAAAGADLYMTKPFDPDELLRRARSSGSGRGRLMESAEPAGRRPAPPCADASVLLAPNARLMITDLDGEVVLIGRGAALADARRRHRFGRWFTGRLGPSPGRRRRGPLVCVRP
jgi:hypothetical protein